MSAYKAAAVAFCLIAPTMTMAQTTVSPRSGDIVDVPRAEVGDVIVESPATTGTVRDRLDQRRNDNQDDTTDFGRATPSPGANGELRQVR